MSDQTSGKKKGVSPGEAAKMLGRLGGLKGGAARAASMTPEERSAAARKAVQARWAKVKNEEKRKTAPTKLFLIHVTFDLVDAEPEDYRVVTLGLHEIGLTQTPLDDRDRSVHLPFNTYIGTFTGNNSKEIKSFILHRIEFLFRLKGLRGLIFVAVGLDYTWGAKRLI